MKKIIIFLILSCAVGIYLNKHKEQTTGTRPSNERVRKSSRDGTQPLIIMDTEATSTLKEAILFMKEENK